MDLATKNKNAAEYKRNKIAVSILALIVIPSGFFLDPMIGVGGIVLSVLCVSSTFLMSKKFARNDELEYAKTRTSENVKDTETSNEATVEDTKDEIIDNNVKLDTVVEFVYEENKSSNIKSHNH